MSPLQVQGDSMPSGMKPTKGTCLLQEQAQVIN
ncbi:RTX toxin RtxA domain protein [Vibrio cholerae]|nr:RTX toxin RtxA domain protein [Vibrio cholerae]